MANLSLELLVDKEKNRVVFIESGKDFVDILLGFLTLPMGTIVRLLGKNSGIGCIDKLYKSVENLDPQYFQTEACKSMLLQPRCASEWQCESLKINLDDIKPRWFYRCFNFDCVTKTHRLYSAVPGAQCCCGRVMIRGLYKIKQMTEISDGAKNCDGVFMKGARESFMISDDLHVLPVSIEATLSLLQRFGIKDAESLERRTINMGKDEILSLLKRMMLSKAPLTDVFLRNQEDPINLDGHTKEFEPIDSISPVSSQSCQDKESKVIHLRLLECKSSGKVVCAEAREDLVDIQFSFLTFPLGSILKLLNKHSSLGCADHLYQSVEVLSQVQECRNLLLEPKVASHFCCSNQLLKIEEKLSGACWISGCQFCFEKVIGNGGKCLHGVDNAKLTIVNPKLPKPGTEFGGGFVRGLTKFMVTNKMVVTPFSALSCIDAVKELQVPITTFVEREITLGETEVLNLLKACLISRTGLTNAFSHKKCKRKNLA